MSKNPNIQEDIDIGALFSQIGKLFSDFLAFVGRVFSQVLHYLILILLFLKKHIIKLGSALVLGSVIGLFIHTVISENYHYDMIVQPNYDAAYQMNERVQYYNQLIKSHDSIRLAELFKIDFEDANSLSKFEMRRQEEKRDIIESYNEFLQDKDSLAKIEITFDEFADKSFSFFDSKYYVLRMSLKKERLKTNIQSQLLADLEANPHLQQERKATLDRLAIKKKNLLKTIGDIDSLRQTYKEVSILAAKNSNSVGTAIDITDSKKTEDNDVRLFYIYEKAYKNLDSLLVKEQKLQEIFKVVTPLKPLGVVKPRVIENKMVLFGLVFFGIMLLYILLKDLNSYLDSYKKE